MCKVQKRNISEMGQCRREKEGTNLARTEPARLGPNSCWGQAKDYRYLYAKQQPKTDNNNSNNNNMMRHCSDTSQLPFKVSQEQPG